MEKKNQIQTGAISGGCLKHLSSGKMTEDEKRALANYLDLYVGTRTRISEKNLYVMLRNSLITNGTFFDDDIVDIKKALQELVIRFSDTLAICKNIDDSDGHLQEYYSGKIEELEGLLKKL